MPADPSRTTTLRELRGKLRQMERSPSEISGEEAIVPSGFAALDEFLPSGGLRKGTLTEWLADHSGSGAWTLMLLSARALLRSGGALVVVDRDGEFYPPAAGLWGVDLDRMVLVRPETDRDAAWAFEQALRCRGVAATLGSIGKGSDAVIRRLGLAAEVGGGVGLLFRPWQDAASHPCWAELRLLVQPVGPAQVGPACRAGPLLSPSEQHQPNENSSAAHGRRVRVTLLSCRGGTSDRSIELDICDDATGDVPLAAELAAAEPHKRSAPATA